MRRGLAAALGLCLWALAGPARATVYSVSDVTDLQNDVAMAHSGDTITVAPGVYMLTGTLLLGGQTKTGGVVLQGTGAPTDTVLVGVSGQTALEVSGPNWTIQQLTVTSGVTGIQVDDSGTGVNLSRLRVYGTTDGVVLGSIGDLVCGLSTAQLSNLVLFGMSGVALTLNSACAANVYYLTTWSVRTALLVQGVSNQPVTSDNLWATAVAKLGPGDMQLLSPTDTTWFVNADGQDFYLAPGSPPVGAGVPISITVDADGNPRPATAPDVGAYQTVAAVDGGVLDAAGRDASSTNTGRGVANLGGGEEPEMGLGCACDTVAGRANESPLPRLVVLGGLVFLLARRRRAP